MNLVRGIETSIFLRLCTRAPLIKISLEFLLAADFFTGETLVEFITGVQK
jgi:hypothetical protein